MTRRPVASTNTVVVLRVLLVVLVLASLGFGALTALSVHSRVQASADLATGSGPSGLAAERLYRSLAAADAAAAGAFVARDRELVAERIQLEADYEAALGSAQAALATLVADTDRSEGSARSNLLATLPGRLLEYSALVQTSVGYNRQGSPVAGTYQLLAADSLRFQLLPAAGELYRGEVERIANDQDRATSAPILEWAAGVVVLVLLIAAQLYLPRQSNRVFNLGLLVATAATLGSLLWVGVSTAGAMGNIEDGRAHGSTRIEMLAQAQVAAHTARATDALSVIEGTDGDGAEARDLDRAKLSEHVLGPIVTDNGPDEAIETARQRFYDETIDARQSLALVPAGALALAALAVGCSAFGLWLRLREYR